MREFEIYVCPSCSAVAALEEAYDGLKCDGKIRTERHRVAVMEKIRVQEMAQSRATDQGGS